MDQRELFEGVRALLEGTGLIIPVPGAPGLWVRLRREGVVVGWTPVARKTGAFAAAPMSCERSAAFRPAENPGKLREVVTSALAMVLARAGYSVVGHDGDLLVLGRPGEE